MIRLLHLLGAAALAASAGAAQAAVSPDEAKQLGVNLTLFGAEMAGNKDGTIPPYTGGLTELPAGFDPKNPSMRPDPFSADKPLYSVNASNMAQHADKLTDGMKTLLQRWPTFRIDVYPTRRSVAYPQFVLDNTVKNATRCTIEKDGNAVGKECFGGLPFPIPKSGPEAIWNHLLRFFGYSMEGNWDVYYVDASGKPVMSYGVFAQQDFPYYDERRTSADIFWRYRDLQSEPARAAGGAVMFIDSTTGEGRKAYQYLPGQRRVKLAPDLAYDTPTPGSGGASNFDDTFLFLGHPDRFDWKLAGKREILIPYNNTRIQADAQTCSSEKALLKDHVNPECVRFELHRVWVVEATLKQGFRHNSPKRVFYFDEDSWGPGLADNYDAAGQLQRVVIGLHNPLYEVPAPLSTAFITYNLPSQVYYTVQLGLGKGGYRPTEPLNEREWNPESMAGRGIR